MDGDTWLNIGLIVLFVLIGGVFAGTEFALVSLRDSQLDRLADKSARGARVAAIARNPNRFLAAVQIGVTVAGFLSAAYGASTLAPDFAPLLVGIGLSESLASTLSLVVLTLVIAYLSLVLGELVPKRIALQRSAQVALIVGPPLDRFATVMRPVIWLLSVSTNAIVRLFGGDPHARTEDMTEEELRDVVAAHEGLPADERRILADVLTVSERSLGEVMRPRGDVVFLDADLDLATAARFLRDQPFSRYPVTGRDFDDILGFVHVRDVLQPLVDAGAHGSTVRDVVRPILEFPSTKSLLPALSLMRSSGTHLAVVVDEYGGTDGIATLEDLVEELVGDIRDEYDLDQPSYALGTYDGGLTIEEFARESGVILDDGPYETVAGFVVAQLGRLAVEGDAVEVGDSRVVVIAVEDRRVRAVEVTRDAESQ